jgi:hypothetical protein
MFHVTIYSLIIIVHVGAAAFLIGGGLSASVLRSLMTQARTGQELGLWLDFGRRAGRLNPAIAMVVLATGIYMGSSGWWNEGWFAFAGVLWMSDALLAVRGIQRSAVALGGALGRARGELTSEVIALRDAQTWDRCAAALRANNVTILYVMFEKPAVIECLVVAALAQAVSFGVYAAGRRRERTALPDAASIGTAVGA